MHSGSSARPSLKSFTSPVFLKACALTVALLPLHSLNASKHQYDHVMDDKKLTVVTVAGPSTVFEESRHLHGFGYDLVRGYAKNLNVKLDFRIVSDNATALKLVSQGKADFAMTTANSSKISSRKLSAVSATCNDTANLNRNGLNSSLNWVFKSGSDRLAKDANNFVCRAKNSGSIRQLASFYNRNVVKPESWKVIQRDLSKRLPIYKTNFKQTAKKYNLDWHLLAAIGYQESYLKANSVSPTGVRGLMMLTNSTAKEMGVRNRTDPHQSIQGGAKYYDQMLARYSQIPYPDRNWYALVAYNMGPGAVDGIRKRIRAQGKDPNNWVHFYAYLDRNKASNGRYRQAVQYVTRIRAYLEHIKTTPHLVNL